MAQGFVPFAKNRSGSANSAPIQPAWILEEPKPFTPYRDAEPRELWQPVFLSHFATHGGKALAADAAGVTLKRVNRLLFEDREFAEQYEHAHAYHRDLLEWESLNLGRRKNNPLPFFDRLKAELPARHVERLQIASVAVTLGTTEADSALGAELLQRMLADMSPETAQTLETMTSENGALRGLTLRPGVVIEADPQE